MYIITDVHIALLSTSSVCYDNHLEEDPKFIFLERISEHLYNYYQVKLNTKLVDILSENRYDINNELYLKKNKTEEDKLEVFLYKKVIKKGFIFNTLEEVVISIFQLQLEKDLANSVKTVEYVNTI